MSDLLLDASDFETANRELTELASLGICRCGGVLECQCVTPEDPAVIEVEERPNVIELTLSTRNGDFLCQLRSGTVIRFDGAERSGCWLRLRGAKFLTPFPKVRTRLNHEIDLAAAWIDVIAADVVFVIDCEPPHFDGWEANE